MTKLWRETLFQIRFHLRPPAAPSSKDAYEWVAKKRNRGKYAPKLRQICSKGLRNCRFGIFGMFGKFSNFGILGKSGDFVPF